MNYPNPKSYETIMCARCGGVDTHKVGQCPEKCPSCGVSWGGETGTLLHAGISDIQSQVPAQDQMPARGQLQNLTEKDVVDHVCKNATWHNLRIGDRYYVMWDGEYLMSKSPRGLVLHICKREGILTREEIEDYVRKNNTRLDYSPHGVAYRVEWKGEEYLHKSLKEIIGQIQIREGIP